MTKKKYSCVVLKVPTVKILYHNLIYAFPPNIINLIFFVIFPYSTVNYAKNLDFLHKVKTPTNSFNP